MSNRLIGIWNKLSWLKFLLLLVATIVIGVFVSERKVSSDSVLRVAVSGAWGTVHPGLQHTLVGDLVLSNQFEALVGVNENGISVPLGATSWTISDDFRVFRFTIDTSKTFSDGSHLTAHDYKASWETAAELDPISANNSLLDVLYKIEGFDGIKSGRGISGIIVHDEQTLEVKFSSPFRMALEHLQGNRFAAYKEHQGKFIGTGVYVIEEREQNRAVMRPRSEWAEHGVPTLDLQFISPDRIVEALIAREVDAIFYLNGGLPQISRLEGSEIEVLAGLDSLHMAFGINSRVSSIFARREFRLAFQYLLQEAIKKDGDLLPKKAYFDSDAQFYLPLQAGRLEAEEVEQLVNSGKEFVSDFLTATKEQPILVFSNATSGSYLSIARSAGVEVSNLSRALPPSEFVKAIYSKDGPDAFLITFSIASGDPDGLYHVLGEHGAIRSPYIYSPVVGELLEAGRKIADIGAIDAHYQKVSRALLTEVPMIHLGFSKAVMAYRKERVRVDGSVIRRNQGQLHFLRAVE